MKIYIPLFYSEKIKRPGQKYFLYHILGEDFAILLLSFTFFSSHPLSNVIGLFLLQIAFWCIYEVGYVENDIIGEKFEDKAVLSYNYDSYEYSFRWWQPWIWAFCLSILGIIVLREDIFLSRNLLDLSLAGEFHLEQIQLFSGFLSWVGFLLALRLLFHIYNNLNKQSRVWFYLLLQSFRYCGYLVLLTTNIVGLIFLVSKILTRSIQYILYRYMGGKNSDWPMDFPRYFFCLLIYLLLLGIFTINNRDLSLILNYQAPLIVVFCLLRGAKNFQKVSSQFIHVREDGSNRVT
ncbi:MAG: hypothetical protein AAGF83_03370 [Cyanobacteria bacterium P01_G01_bin.67]